MSQDITHHPDCPKHREWPMCCGSPAQVEEHFDEHFDDYYAEDYNLAEAEEN